MKIRTILDLKDNLDKDFAWRTKELSNARFLVKSTYNSNIKMYIRSSLMLLYAHWEGFIKNAASVYLNLVRNQSLKYNELIDCFVALSLKQKIKDFEATNKATIHTQFIHYINTCSTQVASINDLNIISTGSNLNSNILREILTTIGIDYSMYELKANLIDEQLLNYRNTIAHGEFLKVDQKEYYILHDEIFIMMRSIKDQIENAAALRTYKI